MCAFRVLHHHKTVYLHYICLNYSFEAGSGSHIGGWSYIERSEPSCIRNRSGLITQSGDRSAGRTGVGREVRDLSVGASGIQLGYSGCRSGIDTLFNQSGNFFTRPSHKNWSACVGGWSAVWCEWSLTLNLLQPITQERFDQKASNVVGRPSLMSTWPLSIFRSVGQRSRSKVMPVYFTLCNW